MNSSDNPYLSDGSYMGELRKLAGGGPYGDQFREELYVSVFRLDFDRKGRARFSKRAIGKRCVVMPVNGKGGALLCDTVDGQLNGMCEGYWAESARAFLTQALARSDVVNRSYLVQWLTAPSLLIEAVWLKARAKGQPDLMVPVFFHDNPSLRPEPMAAAEFLSVVEALEQERRAIDVDDGV